MGEKMTNVFFTVDTEIWLGGWNNLDSRFPNAFRSYVYGPTQSGHGGLPLKLKILNDNGLIGVFFVEPLFASRFGIAPLQEIVGLIQENGHEVQMHLHTEWADESPKPLIPSQKKKRQFLFMYSAEEQRQLIAIGKSLLLSAGAPQPNAFRAGSFGCNSDTFYALSSNKIPIDSSYNHLHFGQDLHLGEGKVMVQPFTLDDVTEFPMTVYEDHPGHYRHLQLGACSSSEIESVFRFAGRDRWDSIVILSHNFELLNQRKNRIDSVVLKRFRKLARFLDRNRDQFPTSGFRDAALRTSSFQPEIPRAPLASVLRRYIEQSIRRVYR